MDRSQDYQLLRDKRRKMYERVSCVLALVALIVVCSGVGKLLPSPLAPLAFDGPSVAAANEQGMVVADTDCTRLLFLDASHELVHAERIDNGEVPITEITCLAMSGNDVYVAGFTCADDGENIISESVLKYDLQGVFQQRIWERTYEKKTWLLSPA